MPTSVISNSVTDPGGNPVPSAAVNIRLMANGGESGGFRLSDGSEVASLVTLVANTSGSWSQALENNANITPAGTYYTVEEQLGSTFGGSHEWSIISASSANPSTVKAALAATIPSFTPIVTVPTSVLTGNNTFTGTNYFALAPLSDANLNTFYGTSSLAATSTGIANSGFGYEVLLNNSLGSRNTGVGEVALFNLAGNGSNDPVTGTGDSNTSMGGFAGWGISTGSFNASFGYSALCGNGGPLRLTGKFNAMFGCDAGIFVGNAASYNSGFGESAMAGASDLVPVTGNNNNAFGYTSLALLTSGANNVGVGIGAGYNPGGVFPANATKTGQFNTLVGNFTGSFNNADPTGMTVLGYNSTAAQYSTSIGANVSTQAAGAVAIGTDSTGQGAGASGANQIVFGTALHQTCLGTSAPATTATTGLPYMPATAGAPTGVPTAQTGYAAFRYDTTNNKIWVYNGAWRGVVVA